METSKIFGILSGFNKYDKKAFSRFLSSPWIIQDASLKKIFKLISEGNSDLEESWKETLYKKVFPDKKYNNKHLRYLLSALTQGLENFIACQELFKDSTLLVQLKMKGLSFRNNEKAYDYEHIRYEKWVNSHPNGDADYYLRRFLNSYQHLNYTYRKTKRKNIIRFDQVMLYLDRFYVAKKLQLLAEMENAQNVLAADYKIYFANETKKLAAIDDFQQVPVIAVYYHILMTLTGPDQEKHFKELRKLLTTYGNLFELNELNDVYQYVRNYCIKKINTGNADFQLILFEIYKEILTNKKLLQQEYLSQWEFKNITTLGLRLGQLDWVHEFIQKYSYYLRPVERKNAILYNTANLHFHRHEYSLTLKLFQKVEFTDVYYQLDTRSIQLKIYYETEEEDALLFHAAAFRIFLKRNRLISVYQRTIYKNLIRFTIQLMRAGTSRSKITALNRQFANNPKVADAQWVKQKLDELS